MLESRREERGGPGECGLRPSQRSKRGQIGYVDPLGLSNLSD